MRSLLAKEGQVDAVETTKLSHEPEMPGHAGWRHRAFAWLLAKGNAKYERAMAPRKRALLGSLSGTIVEIGPGAGVNLAYYAPEVRWIGMEPNPYLHPYLQKEAEKRGLRAELRRGVAERLGVEDGSADAVVSTLVLCSVEDQAGVLREVLRVLKPGGRFVFIEHIAAPAGTRLRRVQRWLRPFTRALADGCCPDRETWVAIEKAGFASVNQERFRGPAPIAWPHMAGVASKRAA